MKTTHIICILDRSGSMSPIADEVIGGFNNFIDEQKKVDGEAKVTLVLFDDLYEVVHNKVDLNDVPALTGKTYFTRGMTGLYDAIGKTLTSMKSKKKAIVFIQTDGAENASREYKGEAVKSLIASKESDGWEFQFLGADMDAIATGGSLGISANDSLNYSNTKSGNKKAFASMSLRSTSYRTQ